MRVKNEKGRRMTMANNTNTNTSMCNLLCKGHRDLVICNNCLWSASLLKGPVVGFKRCPVCRNKDPEVIPVGDYENYKIDINSKRGLEISFTIDM
jgi:hypothetical protein